MDEIRKDLEAERERETVGEVRVRSPVHSDVLYLLNFTTLLMF